MFGKEKLCRKQISSDEFSTLYIVTGYKACLRLRATLYFL